MSIRDYLPSRQFSKFIGIAILIGVVIFVLLKVINLKSNTRQKIQNIATREIVEDLDTDSDGVKDWEEALWGLDFNNPDTNEDGILDGQEVEKRRNELRASDEFIDVPEIPETETERIARQLLTVALNVNQVSGGGLDQQQISSLAEGFIQSVEPNMVSMYALSDLKIDVKQTAQDYYNEMSQELAYLDSIPTNELKILEQAIATNKKNKLKELEPIIEAYAQAPEKVLDKKIPTQVAEYHLAYLNALTQKAIALVSMTQYFDDPVIALRGVQEYAIADNNLVQASQNIQNYLQKNGIVR
jgi:hypothetical protein